MNTSPIILASLFSLAICSSTISRPSIPVIRECPSCKVSILDTQGADMQPPPLWTDQITGGHRYSLLAKCPGCDDVFLLHNAKKLERQYSEYNEQQKMEFIRPTSPSESEYQTFIKKNQSSLTKDKEMHLRKCLWWLTNDPYRVNPSRPFKLSTPQKDNLEILASLLNEQDDWQRFIKADIYRQLGQFRKCKKTLGAHYGTEQQQEYAQYIESLATWRVRVVKRIPWGNNFRYGLADHFKSHPVEVSIVSAFGILIVGIGVSSIFRHRKKLRKIFPTSS